MKDWLPNDVGRIKDEVCIIVADVDLMGSVIVVGIRRRGGGSRSEQSDSAEKCESREQHGDF